MRLRSIDIAKMPVPTGQVAYCKQARVYRLSGYRCRNGLGGNPKGGSIGIYYELDEAAHDAESHRKQGINFDIECIPTYCFEVKSSLLIGFAPREFRSIHHDYGDLFGKNIKDISSMFGSRLNIFDIRVVTIEPEVLHLPSFRPDAYYSDHSGNDSLQWKRTSGENSKTLEGYSGDSPQRPVNAKLCSGRGRTGKLHVMGAVWQRLNR